MGKRLRLLLPLALILLVGCRRPNYQSSRQVSYYWVTSSWEPDLIEQDETWLVTNLLATGRFDPKATADAIGQAQVSVYADKIACQSATGYCNGLGNGFEIEVRNLGCPFNSALAHELTHLIQEQVLGVWDYNHTDTQIWSIADSAPGPCP